LLARFEKAAVELGNSKLVFSYLNETVEGLAKDDFGFGETAIVGADIVVDSSRGPLRDKLHRLDGEHCTDGQEEGGEGICVVGYPHSRCTQTSESVLRVSDRSTPARGCLECRLYSPFLTQQMALPLNLKRKRDDESITMQGGISIFLTGEYKAFCRPGDVVTNTKMTTTVSESPVASSSSTTTLPGREEVRLAEETVSMRSPPDSDVSCVS
jgi:hypothetical protein